MVAQTYLDKPFLVDNLKFDLRIYVLLYGVNPLKIYLLEDGLARFATTPYQSAKESDITDLFMHLTNYSLNKISDNFEKDEPALEHIFEPNGASKRTLAAMYKQIEI